MYDITGLTRPQLTALFELLIHRVNTMKMTVPRHTRLPVIQQITATLIYLRRNRTQADLACTYAVSQPTISRMTSQWTQIIAETLREWIPTGDDLREGETYLVDGTLVPSWSWKDHREDWSGKHKTTGRNLITVSLLDGTLVCVSDAFPGSTHDLAALRETHFLETPNTLWIGDKGFVGPDGITTPIKRKPGQQRLEPDQVEHNRRVSSERAPIERANAQFKTWRILHTDYRRPHDTHDETITAVLGLEFWRNS